MSNFAEQQTEWILNNILVNGEWVINNTPKKNVYFQKARPEHQHLLENFSKKKGYKKPDYILYTEYKLAGIIEAKRGGESLDKALKQATEYADMLEAPLVFASNGAYVETYHLTENKPLFINGEKVDRLIKYKEAVEFIKSGKNEIYTFPPELIKSKEDLIRIFKKVNNLLRKANIFAGYDRISEFSSILFLKLISEQEGEKSYWNSIKKQDDDFLLSYLNGTVIKTLEDKYHGGVFSEINLKKASVMRQIINIVDPLVLSDIKTDIKGDAFEYFLKNMNQADNDLGQYFTPRHIVKAMVHLIDPKFKETIYDPFCGTGGFLIEAFNHIKENSIIKTEEDRKILRENTLFGRDATKVSTIAKKNMILHGDGHSNIEEKDSLEHPIEKKMSAILTNIPFSLKDVDYTDSYYNGLGKKNGDAICVLHCLDALEEGGRMAVIVPEGFLFKKELKEIRKFLLSRANLELIVSLPQGIFLPYTGVKTDILYFTNAHKPQTREGYYYFEVKKDGFTLDAHRRKIDGANDIHKLEAINIRKGEKELLKKQGFEFIDFEKVRANDYNLVGNVYREHIKNNEYINVKLFEVCNFLNGYAFKSNNFSKVENSKRLQVIRIGDINKNSGVVNIEEKIYHKKVGFDKFIIRYGDILVAMTGATVGKVGLYLSNADALLNQRVGLLKVNSNALKSYIYYILRHQKFYDYCQDFAIGTTQGNISAQQILDFSIPLISLPEQQEIVNELDSYQKIVDGAKQIVDNWKPYFKVHDGYEIRNLGDIAKLVRGPFGGSLKKEIFVESGFKVYEQSNCIKNDVKIGHYYITESKYKEMIRFSVQENDILMSCSGTIGKVLLLNNTFEKGIINQALLKITPAQSVFPKYLYWYMLSNINFDNRGIAIQNIISVSELKNTKISLPPLHIQQEIVEKLEQERRMIDSQKEIIKLFEAKIQNKLNSILQI